LKGLVLKSTGSLYSVKSESGNIYQCSIKGKLRTLDLKSTNPIAVGDNVTVELINEKDGVIKDILDRKNYIIRKSSNLSKQSHIIAANIDEALLIVTLVFPETSLEFIDRFLVAAEAYQIPVTIVLNKIDLYESTLKEYIEKIHQIYEPIGYKVIEVSALTGKNINELKSHISNKVTVLAGNSGVGKSTLINSMYTNYEMKTGAISEYHLKGKHTTTFAEMVETQDNGYIIDTPGIKGFGIINIEREEIYHFFPEIFNSSQSCQYNNCLHIDEPNCAVKKAVEEGFISESRYISYRSIMDDQEKKYR
jgi:ribosome biogenesis GTPase / thiamine phosphate phosphatase